MAVLSDYTSGTISLANGSTTVTGTGTLFEVTRFREGDTLQIQNLTAVIASVDSDTQLTLTEPWTGTSIVDGPYRARQLADGTRVGTQAATLIELLGDGTLAGIAALGVEEGKALVGGPAGQYELVDTSSFGIQDPNGSLGKLATLTLEARQILQTDAAGDLKQVALAANKALATNANGDIAPIDLGTLGRALLALNNGTNAQIIQADGAIIDKSSLPVSTATQTALNAKLNLSGGTLTNTLSMQGAGTNIFSTSRNSNNGAFNTSPLHTWRIGSSNSGIYGSIIVIENVGSSTWLRIGVAGGGAEAAFDFNQFGALNVPGAFTAGSKSFLLDHPNDPYNKDLVFMSTEAPKAGVEFWGTVRLVDGVAEVDLDSASNLSPGTFVALTQNAIPLKPNNLDGETEVRAGRVVDGKFSIFAVNNHTCNDEVSWHVKAERADPFIKTHEFCDPVTGLLIPEHEKEDA